MNEVDETTGDDEPVSPRGPELEPSDQVTRHELRVAPPHLTETALLMTTGVGCCDGESSLSSFPPHAPRTVGSTRASMAIYVLNFVIFLFHFMFVSEMKLS